MAKVKVNITLDEDLIGRIDGYADENYMSRSTLISLFCTHALNAVEVTRAIQEMSLALRKIADTGEIDDDSRHQLEDFERLAKLLVMK